MKLHKKAHKLETTTTKSIYCLDDETYKYLQTFLANEQPIYSGKGNIKLVN